MFKNEKLEQEFKERCDGLFKSYCDRGWVSKPENKPIYYTPNTVARSGSQENTQEAKRTGHKSPSSIVSRIKRDEMWQKEQAEKNRKEGKEGKTYPPPSLATVSDLTRCTMITKSFEDAPDLIKKLGQQMPNLNVWVCDLSKETGYCAIHLKGYNEEGIPFEVQVHTPETFYMKQVSEYEYAHYRDFNAEEQTNKANQIKDPKQREAELDKIKKYTEEKQRSDQESKDLYDYLLSSMDARIFEEPLKSKIDKEINAIQERFKENDKNNKIPKPEKNKYIKQFVKTKVENLEKVLNNSVFIKKVLPEAQCGLINNCELCLDSSLNKTTETSINKVSISEIKQERREMNGNENTISSIPTKSIEKYSQNKEQTEQTSRQL